MIDQMYSVVGSMFNVRWVENREINSKPKNVSYFEYNK